MYYLVKNLTEQNKKFIYNILLFNIYDPDFFLRDIEHNHKEAILIILFIKPDLRKTKCKHSSCRHFKTEHSMYV